MRPNVLFIVLDTARADAFEPYGAPAGTTPTIAQLASSGRALPHVRATASWTLPSHASMFTGAMARELGLTQAPGEIPPSCKPAIEAASDRLLPEVLRRSGYRTRGVSCNIWITNASGFGTGFDDFRDVTPDRASQMASRRPRPRARWALDCLRARSDDGAAEASRILREWFAEEGEGPDFWFVNLIECHSPYLPPKPWNDLGPLARIRSGEEARRHLSLTEIWRVCVSDFDVPKGALERMKHLYDCSIRQLDDWVAEVLTALDSAGKLDDTLVIVCSDHGENFGEGGLLGHAFSLDERLIHVPFVTSGPGAPADMKSLAELPRAIAEAVGLEDHPWAAPPTEIAVSQFDSPGSRDDPRKSKVVEEWGAAPAVVDALSMTLDSAVRGNHKLLRTGAKLELYDLEADPLEEHPREVSQAEAPADLLAAIEGQGAAEPVAAPAGSTPDVSPEELARIEDQMRTLGYF